MNNPIDMGVIRSDCAERIALKLKTAQWLGIFTGEAENGEKINNHGRRDFNADILALGVLADAIAHSIRNDIWLDISQLASLMARDVIVETVRQEGNMEPIVWLTGNSMAPAYRCFHEIEVVWQEDVNGEFVHELWESIERKCLEMEVFVGYPDDDNSMYGVDMRKWEQSEASAKDEPIDNLNDEWSFIDPEPKAPVEEPTQEHHYVLEAERLLKAEQAGVVSFELGQTVQFKEPNKAAGMDFTITDIGRDSDGDVWVKVNNDQPAFFDWPNLLIPAPKED